RSRASHRDSHGDHGIQLIRDNRGDHKPDKAGNTSRPAAHILVPRKPAAPQQLALTPRIPADGSRPPVPANAAAAAMGTQIQHSRLHPRRSPKPFLRGPVQLRLVFSYDSETKPGKDSSVYADLFEEFPLNTHRRRTSEARARRA